MCVCVCVCVCVYLYHTCRTVPHISIRIHMLQGAVPDHLAAQQRAVVGADCSRLLPFEGTLCALWAWPKALCPLYFLICLMDLAYIVTCLVDLVKRCVHMIHCTLPHAFFAQWGYLQRSWAQASLCKCEIWTCEALLLYSNLQVATSSSSKLSHISSTPSSKILLN